ncbi:MAG TPA: hypothetical protein VM870_01850, partial [Pyrinomonadaceae bacterium]|nr:hypothetical protein [Pyrinomonadaceae bacterium]
GAIDGAKIILGGVAPAPLEMFEAEQQLIGHDLSPSRINQAAELSYLKARPLDNTDFVMNWRKQMSRVYVTRALEELRSGATAE